MANPSEVGNIMGLLVIPMSWAGAFFPCRSWQNLLPMFLGVAVLVAFGFYEARPDVPIVFLIAFFYLKTGNVALVGGFIHGLVLVSLLQYLPLLEHSVERESAILAAVALLPTSIDSVSVAAVLMM
jgi:hypothetical protein